MTNSKVEIAPNLTFHKSQETLQEIVRIISNHEKGVYLRCGDGDVNIATGGSDMLQGGSSQLQHEMREALAFNGHTILKALPLHCRELGGYEEGMYPGNHEGSYGVSINFLKRVTPFWGGDIRDVYSPVALHYSATNNVNYCVRFLRFLKQSNCIVFIGNENIPPHIREILFGSSCAFIPVPPKQAYKEIDRIEKECLKKNPQNNEYKVIIVAMGVSGRPLMKRLWHKLDNVFLFDFGSLIDALCGWETRAWIKLTQFNADSFIKRLSQDIKIVYTAALIDTKFDIRKKEYLHSLNIIKQFGYEPYIIEAIRTESFFDDYCNNVFYSNVNDSSLRNKGVNEAKSLIEGFKYYNFDDDDIIIKLTGRYWFDNDTFIRLVEDNPDVDAFIKTDKRGQVFTGCFALRYKYFKAMLEQLDLVKMEKKINLEAKVAHYIRRLQQEKKIKVMDVEMLYITANIFGGGNSLMVNI